MRDLDKMASESNEIFDRLRGTLGEMRGIVSSIVHTVTNEVNHRACSATITSLTQNVDDLKAELRLSGEERHETSRRLDALEAENKVLRAALVDIVSPYNSADWCGWCQRLIVECKDWCAARSARAALTASSSEGRTSGGPRADGELSIPSLPVTYSTGVVVSVTERPELVLEDEPRADDGEGR